MTHENQPSIEPKISTQKKKLQKKIMISVGVLVVLLVFQFWSNYHSHASKKNKMSDTKVSDNQSYSYEPRKRREKSFKEKIEALKDEENHAREKKTTEQKEVLKAVISQEKSSQGDYGLESKLKEVLGQDPELIFEIKEKERVYQARKAKLNLRFQETKASVKNVSYQSKHINKKTLNNETDLQPIDPFYGEDVSHQLPGMLLPTGTIMNGILGHDVNSDYQGPWKGLLVRDVYDAQQEHILLPRGTNVVGEVVRVTNVNEAIQSRLGLTVKWLVLPDGKRISLDKKGSTLDMAGVAGIKDEVDRHILAQFLGVSAYALVASSTDRNQYGQDSFSADIGNGLRKQFAPLATKYLSLVPTIKINKGQPIKIFTKDDLYLDPFENIYDSYLSN